MKQCPECGRVYDPSMMFRLDDGAELLYGGASTDEPATEILSRFGVPPSAGPSESATRPQIVKTLEAQPPMGSEGASERQSLSAHRAAEPRGT